LHGSCRIGPADCVRQCREPDAGACGVTRKGNLNSRRAWSEPAAHREPVARRSDGRGAHGRRAGASCRLGATRLLTAAGPAVGLPRLDEISIDMHVFAFALPIAALSGLCFGLLPALHASRAQLNSSLKETARGSTDSASQQRLRSALIVAEVALSVSLLIGA